MKISKSKKQLAKIISESGGWFDGANWAAQGRQSMGVGFSKSKPYRKVDGWFVNNEKRLHYFATDSVLPNWHQTIVSRDEYFHLYPAQDADGWIEWKGGECPVEKGTMLDLKHRDGEITAGVEAGVMRDIGERDASCRYWVNDGHIGDIIAYRLHNPEHTEQECMDGIKPIDTAKQELAIEQLAADYKAKLAIAQKAQEEADSHRCGAEVALEKLVAAGKSLGLVLSVAAPEPELVITDWRGLRLGDEISTKFSGSLFVTGFNLLDESWPVLAADRKGAPWKVSKHDWKFIRRP